MTQIISGLSADKKEPSKKVARVQGGGEINPTNNNAPELADSKGAKNTSLKCNHSNRLTKRKVSGVAL